MKDRMLVDRSVHTFRLNAVRFIRSRSINSLITVMPIAATVHLKSWKRYEPSSAPLGNNRDMTDAAAISHRRSETLVKRKGATT